MFKINGYEMKMDSFELDLEKIITIALEAEKAGKESDIQMRKMELDNQLEL